MSVDGSVWSFVVQKDLPERERKYDESCKIIREIEAKGVENRQKQEKRRAIKLKEEAIGDNDFFFCAYCNMLLSNKI